MEILHLSKPDRALYGHVALDGSKSLSNRALIILALAGADPSGWLRNLSTSKDTATLQRLLAQTDAGAYDAGDAGTTFRFMTAYLATRPGAQVLSGSPRMCQRPVGALVYALRELGADVNFLEREGYPPLLIGAPDRLGKANRAIRVDADVSSQFLSALLMIGPCLPRGLELIPRGRLVSRPYLDMTMRIMRHFGARVDWWGENIVVDPGAYTPRPLTIEADWSAASYWYALTAFAETAELTLEALFEDSWQGDAVIMEMMKQFGVESNREVAPGNVQTLTLKKHPGALPASFKWDFLDCPDIAQTLAVVCAGLGVRGVFTGLETLAIKETDRTAALRYELAKVGVDFRAPDEATFTLGGKASWKNTPRFATYGDHRMAMAFAPLAMLGPVEIEHPAVVAKSYPKFWEHLEAAGFRIKKR
ncbi:MAG: 3-phosphoshikimate 1-carboxyvinyltransferase [Thermoanaerobaculia bacterium]|nr:3-phosphoshikimate 1-carboxyvinyltransferase [Thermoanaerobaculia bacterium]